MPGPLDLRAHVTLVQYLLNKRAFAQVDPLTSGTVFRRGIEWLRANHDDGPFLLWLEAFDPHEPWDPPRAYADRYCPDFAGTEFIMPHAAPQVASDHEKERIKALYYGEITYLDEWIGRLLNTIADLGRLQDTVILFTSDHGTELLDHGRFGKNAAALHPYNTQLNWLIRHPSGVGAGHEVAALVQGHDLFPTILDLLDIPAPEYTDAATTLLGRSVWPLVRAAAGEHVPMATLAAAVPTGTLPSPAGGATPACGVGGGTISSTSSTRRPILGYMTLLPIPTKVAAWPHIIPTSCGRIATDLRTSSARSYRPRCRIISGRTITAIRRNYITAVVSKNPCEKRGSGTHRDLFGDPKHSTTLKLLETPSQRC